MKEIPGKEIYTWSTFSEEHQIDFHSFLIYLIEGNILVDPLPFSAEDEKDLRDLGPIAAIVLTNSDHIRGAEKISKDLGIPIYAPDGEQDAFPFRVVRWLKEGDFVVPEIQVFALEGSKTKGELALLLEKTTLITGDLIRCHEAGKLTLLPDEKLKDKNKAITSIERLAALPELKTVLVGDGGPVIEDGKAQLEALLKTQDV